MSNPIGLGFIGCGKHAMRGHALAAEQMPETFSIRAAFDRDSSAAANLARFSKDAHLALSVEGLLEWPEVEAVIIATPPAFHLEIARQAVKAGKHVFCEKPLWVNPTDDGLAIITEAINKRLVFTSCHPRRFEKCYEYVREKMAEYCESYGKLQDLRFQFFYHRPSAVKAQSLLLDHMSHEIDLANFILGHGPMELFRGSDAPDHYRVEGSTRPRGNRVRLFFDGSCRLTKREYCSKLQLMFERGRVVVDSILRAGMVTATVTEGYFGFPGHSGVVVLETRSSYQSTFRKIMQNFADAIRGNGGNYLTLQDMMVSNAACVSLIETGRFVK